MQTLTQVFYSKFCQYSRKELRSEKGQELIKKATELIRQKEGEEEAKYFQNLMIISEIVD